MQLADPETHDLRSHSHPLSHRLLIVLSAFFNVSETALTAASRARMHALEQDGNSRARVVNSLLRSPRR